jgi:hypothetical protein
MYIPIDNQLGGGVDISLYLGRKAWCQKKTFVRNRVSKEKDSTQSYCMIARPDPALLSEIGEEYGNKKS